MTAPMPPYHTGVTRDGMTEVHVPFGVTKELIITMRPDLVGTDTGDEIIRRAVAAHREQQSIVHGEGS